MKTVGTCEARSKLPDLLRRVEAGETIVITRHGREVAQLVPPASKVAGEDFRELAARWREVRKHVHLRGLKVRDLLEEGRA